MKIVSCRDVGMDCDFVARGETEGQVLQQVEEHARTYHEMAVVSGDVLDMVRAAIHEEPGALPRR